MASKIPIPSAVDIVVRLKTSISFWEAIKLRIAGATAIERLLERWIGEANE